MLSCVAALAAFATSTAAFMPPATPALASIATRSGAMTSLHMSGTAARVNTKIDLDSPKVATQVLDGTRAHRLTRRARANAKRAVKTHAPRAEPGLAADSHAFHVNGFF